MARRHGLLPVSHPSTQLDNCTSRGTERRQPPSDWDLQRSFESVTDRLQLEPKALTGSGVGPLPPGPRRLPVLCSLQFVFHLHHQRDARKHGSGHAAQVVGCAGNDIHRQGWWFHQGTRQRQQRLLLTGSERFTWRCNGNVMSVPNWNELTVSGDTSQDFTSFFKWIFCPILFYF